MSVKQERPVIRGVRAPLTDDSPQAWWEEEATRLGLTVHALREQIRLADETIAEIVANENQGSKP